MSDATPIKIGRHSWRIYPCGLNHFRRKTGQGLMEFALVLPIFLTVLFALIEAGWAIYSFSTVQNAANEGVRRAIVLNRPSSNYDAPGNAAGTFALSGQTCNRFGTILQSVACSTLTLPQSRITVYINYPFCAGVMSTCYPTTSNVIAGQQIKIEVRYQYAPLVTYAWNLSGKTMTGYATSETQ